MQKNTHYLLYAVFLVLLMTERFLVPFDTYNIVSAVIGLLVVALCATGLKRKKRRETLSLTFRWEKPGQSVLYAVVVPLFSVVVVLALEQLVFHLTGHNGWFLVPTRHLYFGNPRMATVLWVGVNGFIKWALIGIAVTFVRTLFLETSFRGYGLYANAMQSGAQIGNLIHTACFTVVMGVPPIYGLVKSHIEGEMISGKEWTYIVAGVAILIYLFLLGFRQGELRLLSQSVIPCILSYWILDFSTTMVNTPSFWPAHLVPFASVFRMLAVQIVACLLSLPMFLQDKDGFWNRKDKQEGADVDIDEIAASVLRQSQRKEKPQEFLIDNQE